MNVIVNGRHKTYVKPSMICGAGCSSFSVGNVATECMCSVGAVKVSIIVCYVHVEGIKITVLTLRIYIILTSRCGIVFNKTGVT
jgi:hypothetical protein